MVPQAAVPGGAARRPDAVPFGERLLVGVVDAAGAPERRHPPLLGALDPPPGEGDFVGTAGAGGGPGWRVYAGAQAPGRAVCVSPRFGAWGWLLHQIVTALCKGARGRGRGAEVNPGQCHTGQPTPRPHATH